MPSWLKLDGTANRPALAGLLVFVLLALFVVCSNSSVNDEYAAHITGGYFYWHTGQFAGGVDNPPLGQLWVSLPLILTGAPLTPFSNELVWLPRLANVLLGAVLLWWIFRESYRYFGTRGALISLVAGIFSPNFLAHSSLATLEIPSAFTVWASTILFWRFFRQPTHKNSLWLGMALGCAFLVKITAFYLPIVFCFLVLLLICFRAGRRYIRKMVRSALRNIPHVVTCSLIILAVSYFIICAGYKFAGIGAAKESLIAERLPAMSPGIRKAVAVASRPLPDGFVSATVGKIHYAQRGNFSLVIDRRMMEGWVWYYPLVLVLKMPIPLLIGMIVCLFHGLYKRRLKLLFPWCFPVVFLVLAISTNNAQIGLRHLIPMFPFLFLALGSLPIIFSKRHSFICAIVGGALVVLSVSSLPYPLTYTSLLTFGNGYQWLVDANYDWGQANGAIDEYSKNHPDVEKPDSFAANKGTFILRVNKYNNFGVMDDSSYLWLQPFKPVKKIAGVGLIFEIGDREIETLKSFSSVSPVIAVAMANYHANAENYGKAENLFSKFLEDPAERSFVLRHRAKYWQERNKLLEADHDLREASRMEPEDESIRFEHQLAQQRVEVNRLEGGDPVSHLLEKAGLMIRQRKYDLAGSCLKEAEKLGLSERQSAWPWLQIHCLSGEWDEALDRYEVVNASGVPIEGLPGYQLISRCVKGQGSAADCLEMAKFCFENFLFDQAAVFCTASLQQDPTSEIAATLLGEIIVKYVQQDLDMTSDRIRKLEEIAF